MNKPEIEEIRRRIMDLADPKYKNFQGSLIPTKEGSLIVGVRTPQLRELAKEISKMPGKDAFLEDLPHTYFEENQLHAFLIGMEKDYDKCLEMLEVFLPYVDNWATCDQMLAKALKKDLKRTREKAFQWIESEHTYTIRFGVKVFMDFFLGEAFDTEYLEKAIGIQTGEYYVKMMIAWYFATALAKQYEATIPYIEEKRLETWTHNKAIQKARESFRVSDEQKEYLKSLKK